MMQPIETIITPQVQKILDHFCRLFDVRIAYFTPQGEERVVGEHWPVCGYCQLLRTQLGFERQCQALDRQQLARAREQRDLVAYECHGGLTEAIMPLEEQGQVIGFVMIGQFRTADPLPRDVQDKWTQAGGGTQLGKAFKAVTKMTPSRKTSLLEMFRMLVQFIVSQHLIRPASHLVLRPIMEYLHADPARGLTLTQAAALAGRSTSTVSHLFPKVMGCSLKQYQIELKLAAAEQRLRAEPSLSVAQVAHALGFEDPLYFSRLYRKHRGRAPSQFKRELIS